MRPYLLWILALSLIIGACTTPSKKLPAFSITLQDTGGMHPLDGRLLLLISIDSTAEPRFQIADGSETQQVFGMDVEGVNSGSTLNFDGEAFGYPVESMTAMPDGDYWVQALLHKYETFSRSDGYTVKMPMDRGEGQQWNRAPGNLYSLPQKVRIQAGATINLVADHSVLTTAGGIQIHQICAYSVEIVDRILGQTHVPGRLCPPAGRL